MTDIRRSEERTSDSKGGGDFHTGIWADMKAHATGRSEIRASVAARVATNRSRKRLYPLLGEAFLSIWNEKMRWRNEPFEFVPFGINGRIAFENLDAVVKVENAAGVVTWDGSQRVIYPYFYEEPALSPEATRLGLWAMSQALSDYPIRSFRIVDVLRRTYLGVADAPLQGDEREKFVAKYASLLDQWETLKAERRGR